MQGDRDDGLINERVVISYVSEVLWTQAYGPGPQAHSKHNSASGMLLSLKEKEREINKD